MLDTAVAAGAAEIPHALSTGPTALEAVVERRSQKPWESDPEYRELRVSRAADTILATGEIDEVKADAALRHANFCAREVGDLWPAIWIEVAKRLAAIKAVAT